MMGIKHYASMSWGYLCLIVNQFFEKKCQKSAASLTYVTLFAIVPMMTVTYSMFSVIPAFQGLGEQLQGLIFNNLLPETGQELVGYLQDFSQQARKLTVVGVVFLVVSAYFMLANIEENFNAIWGISEGRKGLANFLLYWAILSLGPLLLGVGLAMSTYLVSLQFFTQAQENIGLIAWLFRILPLILSIAAFTLLFAAVPNCKVPLTHALVGGIVTSIAFTLLKTLFSVAVSNSSYTNIYGAFAIVPLFLLWINITWMIVLAGAVLVRTISGYKTVREARGYPELLAGILVLWEFSQAAKSGGRLADEQLLKVGLSEEQWQRIGKALLEQRVITSTGQGDYVLSYDLHVLSLHTLAGWLTEIQWLPESHDELKNLPWYTSLERQLGQADQWVHKQFDMSLAELFEHTSAVEQQPTVASQFIENPLSAPVLNPSR